jgi:hypothetical protein
MAEHAGDAIRDTRVRLALDADDLHWAFIQSWALAVHEHVGLKPVGQMKDNLATVVTEHGIVVSGTQGMGEEVLTASIAGEVVTFPISSKGSCMALD